MPALSVVPSYRKFINDRDKALEKILHRCQKETSAMAYQTLREIQFSIGVHYRHINKENRFTAKARGILDTIYSGNDFQFRLLSYNMVKPIRAMALASKTLSYAGELEAITRVMGGAHKATARVPAPNNIEARIYSALTKLQNDIRLEIERGYVREEDAGSVLTRVTKKFPKVVRYKQPPRELKSLTEAFTKEWVSSATVDFIDEATWQEILRMYKEEYVPTTRNLAFDLEVGEPELEEWYGWEIEQEITKEFLDQVRDGTHEAAEQAGIDDLMWIAVLDDVTRPEHRMKDGLTSSEIEAKLQGEWADFEDQGIVAPSGFRCRCRSCPWTANLPEQPAVTYGDFETWLNS